MNETIVIDRIDHLVLTVQDVEASGEFYERVLHMERVSKEGRHALHFGQQKINLHPADAPIAPHAQRPTPGSSDLCLITTTPLSEIVAHLERLNVPLVEGPVRRNGARGLMTSVYLRDPDSNLIEVSEYEPGT